MSYFATNKQEKKPATPTDLALAVALVIALVVTSAMWYGFALKLLWGWFIVPLGVAPITVFWGAGITVLAGFLTADRRNLVESAENKAGHAIRVWLAPAFAIGLGAILHALA